MDRSSATVLLWLPVSVSGNECIEDCDEGYFWCFAAGLEPAVEGPEAWHVPDGGQGRHVECASDVCASAADLSLTAH